MVFELHKLFKEHALQLYLLIFELAVQKRDGFYLQANVAILTDVGVQPTVSVLI